MEIVIVTTEFSIEKIIERVFDKKMPQTAESGIERTFSVLIRSLRC